MTTTPDSRIAHDWHLDAPPGPEYSRLPPGVPTRAQAGHLVEQMTPELRAEMEDYWARAEAPIDTSTTAGKVRVMDASARGESVQQRAIAPFVNATNCDWAAHDGEWNWSVFDYRIAPPPAPRTALQQAREYTMTAPDKVNASSMARLLVALLQEIDASIVVTIETYKFPHYSVGDHTELTPGRYRLLRDDA